MSYVVPTIVALSTPPGAGALGVIRLSGPDAIKIADAVFRGKKLAEQPSHTLHFGRIVETGESRKAKVERQKTKDKSEADDSPFGFAQRPTSQPVNQSTSQLSNHPTIIDEVIIGIFRAPHSYTGEDVAEISCHGSPYILQRVLEVCVEAGAVPAQAGEFTRRAFLNGRLDLTQAEAVGDLIAAESRAAQQSAMHQLRGGFSAALKAMREELITFSALIELELDFSGEDVEFADRRQLYDLLERINQSTSQLIQSFRLGNAVKNGVSVAIIGAPNAGKSTLLNALLNEERAIVSEIAGTTRDTIEEVLNIDGILFRLIDTAGIRESTGDVIEDIGIARSIANAEKADIIIHLVDMMAAAEATPAWLLPYADKTITIHNKTDLWADDLSKKGIEAGPAAGIYISAKDPEDISLVKQTLFKKVAHAGVQPGDTIITSTRHLAALRKVAAAVADIRAGLDADIPGDLIALDIRQALHYIGEITGQVLHDRDVLGAIFGKFCIGK